MKRASGIHEVHFYKHYALEIKVYMSRLVKHIGELVMPFLPSFFKITLLVKICILEADFRQL